jgi:glycosyltransferase involved in cell wall biosynthesis
MDIVDITIVVTTFNRAPMLRNALESLVQLDTGGKFSYNILVVDDGSTDQTAAVLQGVSQTAAGAPVTSIYQKNLGPYIARNRGAEMARGNWLAFFDDDQWAEPGWLAELYRTAQEQRADCVGGAVLLDLPESGPLELGARTRRLMSEKLPGQKIRDSAVKNYIGTGNVLIRRSLFKRVGAFDSNFRRDCDTDFFWRVEKGGFRLAYAPNAAIHHVIPESRLQPSYLRHLCFIRGVASARIRWRYQGSLGLIKSNLWRLGVVLGRDLTALTIAACGRQRPLLLDSLLSFWYSIGFMRGSLFFLGPRIFPQKKFMAAFGSPVPTRGRSRVEADHPTSLRK